MEKKLSKSEIEALANVVCNRVSSKRSEKVYSILSKDEQFIKDVERDKFLNTEIERLRMEKSLIVGRITNKVKSIHRNAIYNLVDGECKLDYHDWDVYVNVKNELIIKNISKDIDIDKLIVELSNKYLNE